MTVDIYKLHHFVSKPIMIEHNIGPAFPNPLLVYIQKIHPDRIEVICSNAAGILNSNIEFLFTQITNYKCIN